MIPGYGATDEDTGAYIDEYGQVHDSTPRAALTRLSDVDPERLTWLWPGRLPTGKLVTLDGDPSVGKSTVAVDWAARVSTGADWPDGTPCQRGDVIILSAEDGLADTIRPRLDAAEGDPRRVHALTSVPVITDDEITTRPPTLADTTHIREAIVRTGARLLIVDVLMAYMPSKVDAHRDQDVRGVLHRIADVATDTGCTIVMLRHMNKSGGGSPMYRGGGSIGIVGAARAGYLIAPDPDDSAVRVLASVKNNLAREPESLSYRLESAPGSDVARIVWLGASRHTAAGLLDANDSDPSERDDCAAFINDYLIQNGGAALARDVQAAGKRSGYSRSTMHRAAERLGVKREKDGMRGPWTWRHPDDAHEGSTEGSEDSSSQDLNPSEPSWNLRGPLVGG